MKNVLVWGTGVGWDKIKKIIDESNIKIIAFIDTYKTETEQFKDGKEIIYPTQIKNYKYDYIIIASSANNQIMNELKNLNISKIKIIDMWEKYIHLEHSYQMKKYLNIRLNQVNNKKIDTIVTGMSYARWGIDATLVPPNLLNLAMDSSDLYSDYLITKKALLLNNDIKNVIIGLSYISFEYDLSKVNLSTKYYCEMIYKDLVDDDRKVSQNILKDFNELKFNYCQYENIGDMKSEVIGNLSLLRYQMEERKNICKEEAIKDSDKNYPDTVKNNIKIIKRYMDMLKEKDCRIIVVIFPANDAYSEYFNKRLKEQFCIIMDNLKRTYDFEIFDYFNCKEMLDQDFRDGSHLNRNGGKKFTKILNKQIFKSLNKQNH